MGRTLFAVYVGGMVEGCHVELHDMRFAVGATIEDCFDDLKAQWWGTPESLHLDAWAALDCIDGFEIAVVDEPCESQERLWFLNLGGYDLKLFTELHRNVFIIAPDWRAAKKKALREIERWTSPHKDTVHEIETIVDVAASLGRSCGHIRLTLSGRGLPLAFEARYVPIGRRK